MSQRYIDRKFREKLEGLEVNPPVEAWLYISEAIRKPSRKGVVPMFLRMAAAVAVLVVSLFSLNFLFLNRSGQDAEVADWSVPVAPLFDSQSSVVSSGEQAAEKPSLREDPAPRAIQPVQPLFAQFDAVPDRMNPLGKSHINRPVFSFQPFSGRRQVKDSYLPDSGKESVIVNTDQVVLAAMTDDIGGHGNVSFGAHFAPQYNYRILRGLSDMSFSDIPFQSLEDQIMTYSAGLNAFIELSPRWTLQTGVNYMNMGQYVKDIMSYQHPARLPIFSERSSKGQLGHPQSIITSQGNIRLADPHLYFADQRSYRVLTNRHAMEGTDIQALSESQEGVTQVFRFVEIPVVFRYALNEGDVGLRLKGGLAASYLLNNDVFLGHDMMKNPIGKTTGIRQFNLSAVGGFAMDIPLTGNLTFHLEPTGQVFISPIVREGVVTGHAYPYGFSLQTGISYGF
ncbi:MAG: hypothetical protein ACLFN2_03130 [Bacteroidales bacterium]